MKFGFTKNGRKLFLRNQSINIMHLNKDIVFMMPNHEKNEYNYEINVCFFWRMNFDSMKNGGKKSFSCKTNASISCTPMRSIPIMRICLGCPIMERMDIIMKIHGPLF